MGQHCDMQHASTFISVNGHKKAQLLCSKLPMHVQENFSQLLCNVDLWIATFIFFYSFMLQN